LGEVAIRQRERRFELPQSPQTRLDIEIGNFARFVGVDVSQVGLKPGETLNVTLYAQASTAANRDYTVFVHLVGEDGRLWAQSDAWPEHGAAPTTSWVAEQALADTHTLTLTADMPTTDAASEDLTIFVGFYDAERGGRVPLYDKTGARFTDDRAPVVTLEVRP